ncbi:response regulator transcription factor [Streptomyces sp. NPDC006654]|uniref:response regulator transcription factor n=1 Tax=Streptomyces sp. NPDC006654 TaxID=3156897 RepID=UPI0033E3E455
MASTPRQLPQHANLITVPDTAVSAAMPSRPPRRGDASGAGPLSVAVTASDALTAEGARACLRAMDGIVVVPWSERGQADIAVVLTHKITPRILARIGDTSHLPDGSRIPVLLVVEDISEEQLIEAVDRGIVGVLLRTQLTYADIVDAVRGALRGESPMPPTMVRTLVDRRRLAKSDEQPQGASLTSREVDVLRLLADGLSTAEVADQLNYSERTIKNILHDVVVRLKLRNRTQAVAYALRAGIL